jgi:hypothetical protein
MVISKNNIIIVFFISTPFIFQDKNVVVFRLTHKPRSIVSEAGAPAIAGILASGPSNLKA